jgi:hypothetical protein
MEAMRKIIMNKNMGNYNQTVNLKEANEKKQRKKTSQIKRLYEDEDDNGKKEDLHKIEKPKTVKVNENFAKRLVFLLAIIVLVSVFYLMFNDKKENNLSSDWYYVKLSNNEVYYGKITDTKSDPIVIKDVYYNYDQLNNNETKTGETGNLRLVKRGKETHGPEGTMNIVRSQVLIMEPLGQDSKVLKAILDYEK